MSAFSQIDAATKTLVTIITLVVALLIIYGLVKIFHVAGNSGENVGDTLGNVTGSAADISTALKNATSSFTGGSSVSSGGLWQKLINNPTKNPLNTAAWTGPRTDSTPDETITTIYTNFVNNVLPNINGMLDSFFSIFTDNKWKILQDFISSIPSQTDVFLVAALYDSSQNTTLLDELNSDLGSGDQDNLAQAILLKPLTV